MPKFVVGTASSSTSGRKMRSPPADIFIWGVHPDTTKEDIVNDLAESDIKIDVNDIVKKSKDDAPLNSYKISVPAADLSKALDASVWPLRVKVREYIYYPKKRNPPQQQDKQDLDVVTDTVMAAAGVTDSAVSPPELTVSNKYGVLAEVDEENSLL